MSMDQCVYQTPRRDFERAQELKTELGGLESKYNAQYAQKAEEPGWRYSGRPIPAFPTAGPNPGKHAKSAGRRRIRHVQIQVEGS